MHICPGNHGWPRADVHICHGIPGQMCHICPENQGDTFGFHSEITKESRSAHFRTPDFYDICAHLLWNLMTYVHICYGPTRDLQDVCAILRNLLLYVSAMSFCHSLYILLLGLEQNVR